MPPATQTASQTVFGRRTQAPPARTGETRPFQIPATTANPATGRTTEQLISATIKQPERADRAPQLLFKSPEGLVAQELNPEFIALVSGHHPGRQGAKDIPISAGKIAFTVPAMALKAYLEAHRPLDMEAAEAAGTYVANQRGTLQSRLALFEITYAGHKFQALARTHTTAATNHTEFQVLVTKDELAAGLKLAGAPQNAFQVERHLDRCSAQTTSPTSILLSSNLQQAIRQPEWRRNERNQSVPTGRVLPGAYGLQTVLQGFGVNNTFRTLMLNKQEVEKRIFNGMHPHMGLLNLLENSLTQSRGRAREIHRTHQQSTGLSR